MENTGSQMNQPGLSGYFVAKFSTFSDEDIRGLFFWGHLHQGHICAGVAEQLDSEHHLQSPHSFQKVFWTKQGFWSRCILDGSCFPFLLEIQKL